MFKRNFDRGMGVVFPKTDQGLYAVMPLGLLSPFGFVTNDLTEFQRAKSRYTLFGAIVIPLSWVIVRYGRNNPDAPTGMFMLALVSFSLVGLYLLMATCFSKIEVYKRPIHGALLR